MRKIFRKLSLKKEKVVNQTTGKKTLKKVVGLLGLVAIITLCAINFKIGFADYNQKSRASLLTLEALTDEIYDGGELPTIVIICDAGNYGRCHYLDPHEQYTGACWWRCEINGNTNSTCYWREEMLCQFCHMLSFCSLG
ncbi:MAG: hypothetical protein LBE18_05215 [Planctomycetaceae bacterium]|jgi:hypothetical protein|nr:hypothetical protein [Planctomycetaceae bacterium]